MKKLRAILSALAVLRRTPSTAIASAWDSIKEAAEEDSHSNGHTRIAEADVELIDGLISAIVEVAKDDEDRAAAPGKADKPAA